VLLASHRPTTSINAAITSCSECISKMMNYLGALLLLMCVVHTSVDLMEFSHSDKMRLLGFTKVRMRCLE